ncbi:MAG: 50S ribosomal protein L10 [Gemmataceae bacterium]
MSKKIKDFELSAMRTALQGVKDFIAIEPIKVDSATDAAFRKTLRLKSIKCTMVKNSLAKKVMGENGVNTNFWTGNTLLCWGGDSVKALANTVDQAIKDAKKDPKAPEKFKVKAAVADTQLVTFEVAKTLPTRQEAIGDLLSAILGPGANIASALTGPAGNIAGILKAIEEKKPDAAPAA